MVVVDKWVAKLIATQAEIKNNILGDDALLQAKTLGHRAGNGVTHNNLEWQMFDNTTQLLIMVNLLDKVGVDTLLVEPANIEDISQVILPLFSSLACLML